MKKILGLILGLFLLAQPLYATTEIPDGHVVDLLNVGGVSSIAVPGTSGSTFSNSFPMQYASPYSLAIKSSATSKFTVTWENSLARPSTEGTTDTATFALDGTTPTLTISDTSLHIFTFTPTNSPFARLKFTGLSGNSNSNTITVLKLYYPEQ
jgi:hypothetical protein